MLARPLVLAALAAALFVSPAPGAQALERSLGNMQIPIVPGLDYNLLRMTPAGRFGSAAAEPEQYYCVYGCNLCRQRCARQYRHDCTGSWCHGDFDRCESDCTASICRTCAFKP